MKNLIKFREINIADAKLILKWRIKKRISNYQFTDIENSVKKQINWIKKCKQKKDYAHWVIMFKEKPIGFININSISKKNKSASWAWYIGSDKYVFLGGFVLPYFYNWVFNCLKLKKLNSFVFLKNKNVIKIHEIHGYRSYKKKYLIKKNKIKNYYIKMTLFRKDWKFDKYKKCVTKFSTNKNLKY